jgi:hypothetical protein
MKISPRYIEKCNALFQNVVIGLNIRKEDFRDHSIKLEKGTILPIIEESSGLIFIDEEEGRLKKLKNDVYVDANSASVALALQLTKMDNRWWKVLERDLNAREDISFNTSAVPEGATAYEWRKLDRVGRAKRSIGNGNVPLVNLSAEKFTKTSEVYELGYQVNRRDLRASILTGIPIRSEFADAALRGFAETINELAYFGDRELQGNYGLINDTSFTSTQAPAGASTIRLWSGKTAAEILADMILPVKNIITASKGKIKPNTSLLPIGYESYVAQMYNTGNSSNITVGEAFIRQCAAMGCPDMKIKFRYECLGDATDGDGNNYFSDTLNRFVVYEDNSLYHEFLIQMMPTFYPGIWNGNTFTVAGETEVLGYVPRNAMYKQLVYNI